MHLQSVMWFSTNVSYVRCAQEEWGTVTLANGTESLSSVFELLRSVYASVDAFFSLEIMVRLKILCSPASLCLCLLAYGTFWSLTSKYHFAVKMILNDPLS